MTTQGPLIDRTRAFCSGTLKERSLHIVCDDRPREVEGNTLEVDSLADRLDDSSTVAAIITTFATAATDRISLLAANYLYRQAQKSQDLQRSIRGDYSTVCRCLAEGQRYLFGRCGRQPRKLRLTD
ncbi:PE domain-containing protein [Mycobacterium uberis]|uniref:PE domain-containing protein n=1 Tax=Mycobacterium uberis TaxID=2162698 RepID=UPI003C758C8C